MGIMNQQMTPLLNDKNRIYTAEVQRMFPCQFFKTMIPNSLDDLGNTGDTCALPN